VAAILLGLVAWIVGVSRSGFWADDYLDLTHFHASLGNLSDSRINTGKYIINVFWAVGTAVFGRGSVVPFLLLDSVVLAAGLVIWLRVGVRAHWSSLEAWWIGGRRPRRAGRRSRGRPPPGLVPRGVPWRCRCDRHTRARPSTPTVHPLSRDAAPPALQRGRRRHTSSPGCPVESADPERGVRARGVGDARRRVSSGRQDQPVVRAISIRSQPARLPRSGGTPDAGRRDDLRDAGARPSQRAGFVAEMSGENGFLVPPINAARAVPVAPGGRCPAGPGVAHLVVVPSAAATFAATG
jgi:hypothetical protein